MKKLLLLFVSVFAFIALGAQTVEIDESFESYNAGDKIAEAAQAAGNDYWTTWSGTVGAAEDGVVAELDGDKVAKFSYGNDQVLLLGDKIGGQYTVEFDLKVPTGNDGYFNMLHKFAGSASEWGFEIYLNSPQNGNLISAGGSQVNFDLPLDTWVPVLIDFDLNEDIMVININDVEVYSGMFSLQATGGQGVRQLAAMDFFPPTGASSEFYVNNIVYTTIAEGTIELSLTETPINVTLPQGNQQEESVTITNSGTSIGEYSAYITYDAAGTTGEQEEGDLVYCNFGETAGAIGYTNNLPVLIEIANKYPAAFYQNKIGASLVNVQYLMAQGNPQNGLYTFRVYGQGTAATPGEVLAEVECTNFIAGTWNTIELPEPILLNGGDIWVSCEFTQVNENEYFAVYEGESINDPVNGDWIRSQGGSWHQLTITQSQAFPIVNWCLKAGYSGLVMQANFVTIPNNLYGSVIGGTSEDITMKFNSAEIEVGVYNATLNVMTNDENNVLFQIPLTLTVEPGADCAAPTNLTVTQSEHQGEATLLLEWDEMPSATGGYNIYDVDNAGNYYLLGNVTSNSVHVTEVPVNTEFCFVVTAVCATTESEYSEIACGTINNIDDNKELILYPNPAKDFVNITNTNNIDELVVYNTLGQKVYQASNLSNSCKVDVANYTTGIYFFVVKSGDTLNKMKVVIE